MCVSDGTERIDDEELLYRRIPEIWYNPAIDSSPSPKAFKPRESDETGLSLFRAKYKSIEEVAQGMTGKRYYVAVLRAGDLRAARMDIIPKPLPGEPGHCEIPSLVYGTRKEDKSQEDQVRLAHELCVTIEGPFG